MSTATPTVLPAHPAAVRADAISARACAAPPSPSPSPSSPPCFSGIPERRTTTMANMGVLGADAEALLGRGARTTPSGCASTGAAVVVGDGEHVNTVVLDEVGHATGERGGAPGERADRRGGRARARPDGRSPPRISSRDLEVGPATSGWHRALSRDSGLLWRLPAGGQGGCGMRGVPNWRAALWLSGASRVDWSPWLEGSLDTTTRDLYV